VTRTAAKTTLRRCLGTSLPQSVVPRPNAGSVEELVDIAFGCRGTAGHVQVLLCAAALPARHARCHAGGGPTVALYAAVGVHLRHAAGKGAEGQAGGNGYGHL